MGLMIVKIEGFIEVFYSKQEKFLDMLETINKILLNNL